jgi:hypothetical protein
MHGWDSADMPHFKRNLKEMSCIFRVFLSIFVWHECRNWNPSADHTLRWSSFEPNFMGCSLTYYQSAESLWDPACKLPNWIGYTIDNQRIAVSTIPWLVNLRLSAIWVRYNDCLVIGHYCSWERNHWNQRNERGVCGRNVDLQPNILTLLVDEVWVDIVPQRHWQIDPTIRIE